MVKVKEWLTFWVFGITFSITLILVVVDFQFWKILKFSIYCQVFWLIVLLFGIVGRMIVHRQLGKYFSVNIKIHKKHELIETGFYKYIRHPMYLFNLLIFLGIGGVFSSILGIISTLVLILPATLLRINKEEYFLIEKLGEKYKKYQKRTKRLIPFVF